MAFSGFERGHRKARTLLQICKELVKKSRQQSAYLSLAQTYLLLGDLNKALDCLANSLEIARETQDIFGEEIALGEIGCVYFKLQDFVKALSFFTSQLHIAKKLGITVREGLLTEIRVWPTRCWEISRNP